MQKKSGHIFISKSEADTFSFASEFSKGLKGGEIIALYGDLGAGKTVFAKGLSLGLGIRDTVTSPTFIIMNEYRGGRFKLYHFDMYRIDSAQCRNLGLNEVFGTQNAICLIEWPENIKDLLPKTTVKIGIKKLGGDTREISVI